MSVWFCQKRIQEKRLDSELKIYCSNCLNFKDECITISIFINIMPSTTA